MAEGNDRSSWFHRNWKWALPLGCLSTLGLFIAFAAGIVFFVFGLMARSDVYAHALERARSNSSVVEALGEPIEPGWYLTGSIHVNGPSGNANIAIPISGSRGAGTVYAIATKHAGAWKYELLEVALASGGERIDLRGE
jgi:hypothetical protein